MGGWKREETYQDGASCEGWVVLAAFPGHGLLDQEEEEEGDEHLEEDELDDHVPGRHLHHGFGFGWGR